MTAIDIFKLSNRIIIFLLKSVMSVPYKMYLSFCVQLQGLFGIFLMLVYLILLTCSVSKYNFVFLIAFLIGLNFAIKSLYYLICGLKCQSFVLDKCLNSCLDIVIAVVLTRKGIIIGFMLLPFCKCILALVIFF